jgi:Flp pilus assembly protein TadB
VSAVAFALGIGFAIGFLLVAHSLPSPSAHSAPRLDPRQVGIGMAVGSVAGVITGWPVGAVVVGAFGAAAPSLLGGKKVAEAAIARTEAVAAWTETLRDTLAAAAGLQRAIMATAPVAPAPIAPEVAELASRLHQREPMPVALRAFADAVGDATADLVVSTLVLAYERQAANLSALLGALAASARDEAAMQRRVMADRAKVRVAVSMITLFTFGAFALLVLFNRRFLEPYDSAFGQVMLAIVGTMFGLGLWNLARLARLPVTERVLTAAPRELAAVEEGSP